MTARSFVFALAVLASGCAISNPASVLAPYAGVPTTCEGIDRELLALAEHDAAIYAARAIKQQTATGIGVAAAAGALPAGFAWAPLAAAGAQQVQLPTHGARIAHLAMVREVRGCAPLEVAQ